MQTANSPIAFVPLLLGSTALFLFGTYGLLSIPAKTELLRLDYDSMERAKLLMRQSEPCAIQLFINENNYLYINGRHEYFDRLASAFLERRRVDFAVRYSENLEVYEVSHNGTVISSYESNRQDAQLKAGGLAATGLLFGFLSVMGLSHQRRNLARFKREVRTSNDAIADWASGLSERVFRLQRHRYLEVFCYLVLALLNLAFVIFAIDIALDGDLRSLAFVSFAGVVALGYLDYLAIYSFRHRNDFDLVVDESGIWLANYRKDVTLVHWHEIYCQRPNRSLQRNELIGSRGQILVRVSWYLEDFRELDQLISDFLLRHRVDPESCTILATGLKNHLQFAAAVAGCAIVAGYVPTMVAIWAVVIVLVPGLIVYLRSNISVRVRNGRLILRRPLSMRTISLSQVDRVLTTNQDIVHDRSQTCIVVKDGSRVRLNGRSHYGILMTGLLQFLVDHDTGQAAIEAQSGRNGAGPLVTSTE
ncbi:MAG: hypothetical protein HUJ31_07710 [Pseudomonadales bacterium]|nr:hypothetical protein [Pseudomonadales bacterium]